MECYLIPPNWFGWTKFKAMEWIWSLLLIAFSMSFPKMFRRMIGQNILRELYTGLFGLGIIIQVDFLKCTGQWPRLMDELAILMKVVIYLEPVTKILRWFHEMLLGSRVNKLLYFFIVLVILALEKGSYLEWSHKEILSSNQKSMEWSQAQLKVWWRTCQRSSNL